MRVRLASFAIALALLGVMAPGAAAVPGDFWGVSPQITPTPEQFQRLRTGGVDSVRIPIAWGAVEKVRGAPDFNAR